MKKVIALIIFCASFILSCKKEHAKQSSIVSVQKIQELKKWFNENKKGPKNLHGKDSADFTLPDQFPIWDSTKFYQEDDVYTTPLKTDENGEVTITKSLVLHTDATGNVISGEYIFIRLTNSPGNLTKDELIASFPKVFEFVEMPSNFRASMIKFNLIGEITYSKSFENNVITDTDERIISAERAPHNSNDGTIIICIDSWWVTYDEAGNIISVSYLYSVCESLGGSGGGGSGPGGSGTAVTCSQSIFDELLDNRKTISEIIEVRLMDQQNGTRTQMYKWYFFKVHRNLATVKFRSTEVGVHNYVNGNWVWQSLQHVSIGKVNIGWMPSICWDATHQPGYAYSVISSSGPFIGWASMNLDYNINVSMSCVGFNGSRSDDYTSHCVFYQNQTSPTL